MRAGISGCGEDLCDTLDTLRCRLFKGSQQGGAGVICDDLDALQLTRDDMLETLVETALDESSVKLDTKTKSAISREWKKRHPTGTLTAVTATNEEEGDYDSEDDTYVI
jgi:hypothetical protein